MHQKSLVFTMGPVYRDAIKGYALHYIPVKYNVQGNCTVRLVEEGHSPGILTVKFSMLSITTR